MRALRVVVLGGLLLMVGCAGSTRSSSTTTARATIAAPVVPSTTRPTSTSSTTASQAVTSALSTAPVASTSTSTTVVLPIEEQVRAAAKQVYLDYDACLEQPPKCDPAKGYLPDSDAAHAFARTMQQMLAGGWYFGPDAEGYQVIESIEQKADHVLVVQCSWVTARMYGPPATPGGEPVVQRNDTGWGREAMQFVQGPDGAWLLRRADVLDQATGANKCPPKQ